MSKKLFCFGYGYSCDFLGNALRKQSDWTIAGTTRDSDKKALLQQSGVKAYIFDYSKPLSDVKLFLKDTTHLLISTPPDDEGDPTFLMHGEDIAAMEGIEWIGYLSTTGVYGNRNGEWVDERSEVRPSSKRGTRRAIAEEQWLSLYERYGLPVHVFRLAGIYGPGRSALDSVRAGVARRIDKPGHVFSRIHVEDIANVLMASMAKPNAGGIYNLCDDHAAPSHEVIDYACQLLGLNSPPLIPFEAADMAPIARSFYNDNKRVHNERIKEELGVTLLYPDYKSGLLACMEWEGRESLVAEHQ